MLGARARVREPVEELRAIRRTIEDLFQAEGVGERVGGVLPALFLVCARRLSDEVAVTLFRERRSLIRVEAHRAVELDGCIGRALARARHRFARRRFAQRRHDAVADGAIGRDHHRRKTRRGEQLDRGVAGQLGRIDRLGEGQAPPRWLAHQIVQCETPEPSRPERQGGAQRERLGTACKRCGDLDDGLAG